MLRDLKAKVKEIFIIPKDFGGFIFIDALIGMLILTVALTATALAYQQSTKQVMFANDNGYASYLAKQTLEEIKNNDRLQQDADGKVDLNLPGNQTITANGVQYTIGVELVNNVDLGVVASYLQPIQATVTWNDRSTGQNRSVVMTEYCYFQPYVAPVFALGTFLPKHEYMFYSGMSDARYSTRAKNLASQNGYPNTTVNGYFYTPISSQYKLWDTCFDHSFDVSGSGSDTYDNRAVVTAWQGGDPLTFYNIDFPSSGANQYDGLTFSARNDAAAGAISLGETVYRDPNQWGLANSNKHYALNVLIDGNVIVQNLLVQASDSSFNIPYAGSYNESGVTYKTTTKTAQIYYTADTLDADGNVQYLNSSGQVTNNMNQAKSATVSATIGADGTVQFTGMPSGNHSISLVWLNDTGDVSKAGSHGAAGTDANILIANISLKQYAKH